MKGILTAGLLGAVSALAIAASPAAAQNVTIVNATVATGDGSDPVPGSTVAVQGGKVVYVGPDSGAPARGTAPVIDVAGAYVTPGLFATVTTIGIWDVAAVNESNDESAPSSPFGASLSVAPSVNPDNEHVKVNRAAGITRAATTTLPADSIFAGQGAIIDLGSDSNPITQARAFQMVQLGESGARRAGGSRAASHTLLRASLREAEALVGATGIPQTTEISSGDDVLLGRFDAEALVPVVRGEQQLYVAVERAVDIRNALQLKREFARINMVLVGASEGWLVADEIAAAGVPVIADGLDDLPEQFEELAATQSNIGRMVAAGVTVAINAAAAENPRRLSQQAGNLVALTRVPGAAGLSWGKALAAISSIPATISGMGQRAGVLAPGALGDVVIWDGDPLELGTVPTRVFIDGIEQPLDSHQSRLRDRYRDLDERDLPKAYDW
jgi:imidazolonepropionase-like amidohydrolase